MTTGSDNLFPKVIIRESANDGSDFSNPTADYRVLFLGEDGLLHVKDSAGTVTSPYTTSTPAFNGARVVNTAGTSIVNATLTAIPFAGAETYDTATYHDTVTNNTRLTAPSTGKYAIGGTVTLASNSATGFRLIGIRVDGTTYIALDERPGYASAASEQYISIATQYVLTAAQYVELIYRHSVGSDQPLSTNAGYGAQFWIQYLGS